MKIVTIIGARPQFIKSAPLSIAFKKFNLEEIVIHTGQHFDKNMSEVFFNEMKIPKPKYFLNINSLNHGAMTGRMLEEIEKILILEKPRYVLVFGDTNSTLAGALAASKLHIDVIHVEAGLRSYNRLMPEEVNRVLTDHLSKYLFCPSSSSIHNLEKEGITKTKSRHVSDVGDIMKDSLRLFSEKVGHLNEKKDTILCTIHRQENVGNKNALENIVNNLNELSKKYKIIFPLHPSTKKWIKKFDLKLKFDISEPLGFLEIIKALKECSIVITDSGGLQKEAYYLSKPCLTLREETEWIELLENGCNTVLGNNPKNLVEIVTNKLSEQLSFNSQLYGSGDTSDYIVEEIINTKL